MGELDFSHLGGAPSYGDAVTGAGDMLLQAIKIRDAKRQHAATVQQAQMALQRQSAKDAQDLQLKRDALAQGDQKIKLEGRRYDEGRNATATTAVEKAYREGGLPAAQTTAGGYNVPLTVEHSGEAPGEPPQAPPEPKPVERPEDLPIPGSGAWPPELRAMMAASQAKAAAAKPRQAPPGTEDAYLPEQEGRPNMPTEPLPANADAVDQELYKSHAQELAEWEAKHKQRQVAQEQLRAFEASQAGQPSPQSLAAAQGFQEQGQRELEHAGQQEAVDQFPAQMREYNSRAEAYAGSAHPVLALGDRKVSLPTQGELDQPNEKAAQDFLSAQLPLAQDPAQIAAIKRTAASIRAGAMKPTEAGKAVETTVAAGTKRGQQEADNQTYRPTVEQQDEWHRLAAAAALAKSQREAAAGIDPKELNAYQTAARGAWAEAGGKVDVQKLKDANMLAETLKQPNGPQMTLTLDGMVKGQVGGRAAQQLIQRTYDALGAADRAQIWASQKLGDGTWPEHAIEQLRKASKDAAKVENDNAQRAVKAVEQKVGPGSAWATRPGLLPYIQGHVKGLRTELGVPDEPPPEERKKTAKGDVWKEAEDL